MKYLVITISLMIISGCARIPSQTLDLIEAIETEGHRMHRVNVSLVNKLFAEKRKRVDNFIKLEYTPQFIQNFMGNVPPGYQINLENDLPDMLSSMIPQINDRRDKMQETLESQRIKIQEKLSLDYIQFSEAIESLKGLIDSAVKVEEERAMLSNQIRELSRDKIDMNAIETKLDSFITTAGDIGEKTSELNNAIDEILK